MIGTIFSISTQGHYDGFVTGFPSLISIATQGHYLLSIPGIISQSISISRFRGGVTITKAGGGIIIEA